MTDSQACDSEVFVSVAERREREREERRNQILDAAKRAFYAKGYALATMDDVADEAQLGKGTLYLYFRTKEDLLFGVAIRHQQQLLASFEELSAQPCAGIEQVRGMLLAYAEHMGTPIEHLKMVMSRWVQAEPFDEQSHNAGTLRENAMRIFLTVRTAIEGGQDDGSIRADLAAGRMGAMLWSSVNGALLLELQQRCVPEPSPLRELAPGIEGSIELLLDAVRPQPERPLVSQDGAAAYPNGDVGTEASEAS